MTHDENLKLQQLIAYFTKRADENWERSQRDYGDKEETARKQVWCTAKWDTYRRAAEKLREVLG